MTSTETEPETSGSGRPRRRRHWARRLARRTAITVVTAAVAVTAASFCYNLATDGPAPRPPGLKFARGGGFDTRYREWGTSGTPVVLVPGAAETADTFYSLGPALAAKHHHVFAIDLIGTGYSLARPPFSTASMARQVIAFERDEHLTGSDVPVLLGHSAGAAVAGLVAADGPKYARGVVFLDGDATPLGSSNGSNGANGGGSGGVGPGSLLIDPFKTSLLRIGTSQGWLVKSIYNSMCGPACPRLNAAGVATWADPLKQPGFEQYVTYELSGHGIPALTPGQFRALRASRVPKLVVFGVHDPQMSASDARATARRIGAPAPEFVPGRHLTMIASPEQVTADIVSMASR